MTINLSTRLVSAIRLRGPANVRFAHKMSEYDGLSDVTTKIDALFDLVVCS